MAKRGAHDLEKSKNYPPFRNIIELQYTDTSSTVLDFSSIHRDGKEEKCL
jgi:hypothetical protein